MLPADKALMERLGARIREIRERAKLSQEAVGEKAGFSGKYIGEIEKGVRDVPLSTLRAVIESGLDLRVDALFLDRPHRRIPVDRMPLARDVELTASMLAILPMKMRPPSGRLRRGAACGGLAPSRRGRPSNGAAAPVLT